MSTELIESTMTESGCRLVFRVELSSGTCLLRFENRRETMADRAVVIVDARRFVRRWQSHYTHMDRREWADQPGFAEAGRRVLAGHTCSPLGIPAARTLKKPPFALRLLGMFAALLGLRQPGGHIALKSGSNRMAWLLANGASAFPLECKSADAAAVQAMVGVPGQPVITASSLPAPAVRPALPREPGTAIPMGDPVLGGRRRMPVVVGLHRVK